MLRALDASILGNPNIIARFRHPAADFCDQVLSFLRVLFNLFLHWALTPPAERVKMGPMNALERWRRGTGMSQEALAELAGVGQSTVDRAESGKASVESARKLASVTAGAVRWVDIFEEVADSDDTDPTPAREG